MAIDEISVIIENKEINSRIEQNGFFVSNEKSMKINIDYDHINNKPHKLIEKNWELLYFAPDNYIIGKFNNFLNLPYISETRNNLFDYGRFTSLNPFEIKTNISALFLAFHSGILNDFIGEELEITHSGCLPTQDYEFFIRSYNNKLQRISLRNYKTQIEGILESQSKVVLVKCDLYKTEDVFLKDLYLAYKFFHERTSKEIVVLYMTFSNDLFKLFKIEFDNSDIMNEAAISDYIAYKLSEDKITYQDLLDVFSKINIVEEKKSIPFPQANDFERIINIIELLNEASYTLDEIALHYNIVKRQSKYYTDAAIYLSLVETDIINNNKVYILTEKGKNIIKSTIKSKYLKLVTSILEHEVFFKVMKAYIEKEEIPTTEEIVQIMKDSTIYNINSDSTYYRRASTVQSWIKWIVNLPKVYY